MLVLRYTMSQDNEIMGVGGFVVSPCWCSLLSLWGACSAVFCLQHVFYMWVLWALLGVFSSHRGDACSAELCVLELTTSAVPVD